MSIFAGIRWGLFALYLAVLFTLPLAILWPMPGTVAGITLTAVFLYLLRLHGASRVRRRLKARALTRAEAPHLHLLVETYCRQLKTPEPSLEIIDSEAQNIALYGFSKGTAQLALTQGLMTSLKREELAAVIAWKLTLLKRGELGGLTWLSQFLSLVDFFVGVPTKEQGRREYSPRLVAKQILLYPMTLIPYALLKTRKDPRKLDVQSLKLSKSPESLTEALRFIDAMRERHTFNVPFSTRHLFLIPPPTSDPLIRLFFDGEDLATRISNLDKLNVVVERS